MLNICLLCDTVAIQGQDTGYGRDSQAFLKPHRALNSTPEHRVAALATQERRRRDVILTSAHEPGVKVLNCVHKFSKTGGPRPSTQVPARAWVGRGGVGRGTPRLSHPPCSLHCCQHYSCPSQHKYHLCPHLAHRVQCSQQRGGAPLPGS